MTPAAPATARQPLRRRREPFSGVLLPSATSQRLYMQPEAGEPLTRRQRECADLLLEGLSNPEIAERMVITTKTAEAFVHCISRKAGVKGRVRAALWWKAQREAMGWEELRGSL